MQPNKQKTSQIISKQDQSEELLINFKQLESKIFTNTKGQLFVGGVALTEQMRGLLRDQATNFQHTNLFEIIDATITNEASNLLLQAGNMEHLQYGKALHYWNNILKQMLNALSK